MTRMEMASIMNLILIKLFTHIFQKFLILVTTGIKLG